MYNLLIAIIWIVKTIFYKEIKNLNKKSQPVSLLADSNSILI